MEKVNVYWTTGEWHTFALNLLSIHPSYLTLPRLPLRAADMRAAMASFAPDRQRPVIEKGGKNTYHKKLLAIYTFFRSKQTTGADGAVPALGAVADAVSATHQVIADAVPDTSTFRHKIRWKGTEWQAVATELLRIRPHERLLTSTTLCGLRTPDLLAAQRCLPLERQRTATLDAIARKRLLAIFAGMKTASDVNAADEAIITAAAPTPAAVPVTPPNPWEAACAPLFALFAEKLADALLPRLVDMLRQPVASQPPIAAADIGAAFSAAVISLGQTQQSTIARSRRIKIGIAGALPIQAQDIAAEFPDIDVLYQTEGSHGILAKMQGVDRMIGMVSKMSHPTDAKLSNHFKERYCRINGAKSMIARQIRIWIASGALA